jgi:flagellar biosynthetic protein FliP
MRMLIRTALFFSAMLLLANHVWAEEALQPVAQQATQQSALLGKAMPAIPALSVTTDSQGANTYTVSLQILIIMTMLSVLPALLMLMTSFTRIIIVFAILRQALGLQQTPSNQILVGMALFLTFFIMQPVFKQAYENGLEPYAQEKIDATAAFSESIKPFRAFMLAQTRESDLALFMKLARHPAVATHDEIPLTVILPSFLTSELKTAFQIGFILFIPFLILDLVIASVLMAMGMMMLSPLVISLPFKIMLFVLVDGWAMIMGSLASSFAVP